MAVLPKNVNLESVQEDPVEKVVTNPNAPVTPLVTTTQSETTTVQPTVTLTDSLEQSKAIVNDLNNIGVVNAPQVSYEGDTAIQRTLEDIRKVNLLPILSNEERSALQENLAVLGTGENQVRMVANAGADSRETANMLAQMYANTSKHGGINLLGATAVLASQRADRAERQRRVAQLELEVAKQNRAALDKDALTRNNNALLPLREESDLLLANERLKQQTSLANAGYDMSAQKANVSTQSRVLDNVLQLTNSQQGLNKAVTVITDKNTKKKTTTPKGEVLSAPVLPQLLNNGVLIKE